MAPSIDRIESLVALPGMQGSVRIPGGIATSINAANQIRQVNTVTVGTVANSTQYNIIIDGIVVSYTSTSADTATGIRDGLVSAVNLAGTGVIAAATDAGVFTLTGYPGVAFTAAITGGGTGYAIASTATASNSTAMRFGLAVARATGDPENVARLATDVSQKFLGVILRGHKAQDYYPEDDLYKARYRHTEPFPRVFMGSVWVTVESPVTVDSEVFVRNAVAGALTGISGFTGTSGAGVVKLVNARWKTGGNEIAELLLSGTEFFEEVV